MPAMRYLIIFCLIMLLVSSFEVTARGQVFKEQPFDQSSPGCCSYSQAIVNPPKGIDFKIIIIIPPKDFDGAMVLNPCPEMQPSPPKVSDPDYRDGVKQFFKLPPFPNPKPSERPAHLWN
jgi:hypothetical protein